MTNNVLLGEKNHVYKIAAFTAVVLTLISIPSVSFAQTTREAGGLIAQQTVNRLKINSITHNGVDNPLIPGEALTIKMEGTAGVQASFLLIGDKHSVREIRAKETEPGIYQTKIPVSPKERIIEGAVIGRLQQGKQVVYSAASQAFTYSRERANTPGFLLFPPPSTADSQPEQLIATVNSNLRPRFISHSNGDPIDTSGLVIQGQTQPRAIVKITVTSILSLVGELIQIEGNTLVAQTVKANSEGIFQLEIPPTQAAPSGLKYIINAVAILNSQTSEPAQLTLVQP